MGSLWVTWVNITLGTVVHGYILHLGGKTEFMEVWADLLALTQFLL